jgi:hypothetical protein
MITTISKVVPGEKFKMFGSNGKLDNKVTYKLRTILVSCKTDMLHLSVSTDPLWFWCIHEDTKVFLVEN